MRAEPRSRVLVTGGAGFIGRRLAGALAAAGHEVTAVDLRPFPGAGAGLVTGDIRDASVLARAVRPGTDTIFHLAAVTSVVNSIDDPAGTYQTNVAATAGLLELARTTGVRAFLFASTNAVVGDVGAATITERSPMRPLSPYGATKAAAEMLLSCYAGVYGMAACALRFSNVYGPGMQHKDSFIPRLMRAARDGKGVQVRGDGSMIRDVVHVDDVIAGIVAAWRAGRTGPVILGSGQSVTVMDMVEAARSVTGAPLPVEHVPAGPGEMPAVLLDISVARELGYAPAYDLKSGLATVWPEFAGAEEATSER
jgi:UDP-glucose 4-epimerase